MEGGGGGGAGGSRQVSPQSHKQVPAAPHPHPASSPKKCMRTATQTWARMHHKVVGNFGSEADVGSLYYSRFTFNETSDVGANTHGRPAKKILTEFRPRYFESEPDFRPMHTKFERLLSKSLTTLKVMTYYLVVHTGPEGNMGTCPADVD